VKGTAEARCELRRLDHASFLRHQYRPEGEPGRQLPHRHSRDATSEQGTIHLERESSAYSTRSRPQVGDVLTALGSWVWDCDHYRPNGEKTELHPFRATWVVRPVSPHSAALASEGDLFASTEATPAGKEAECAHETQWSDQFKACSLAHADWLSLNGSYAFDLPAATTSCARPGLRTVDRGSVGLAAIKKTWTGKAWHLTFGQIATGPGEWQLTSSVDGIWGQWPGRLEAKDGSSFAGGEPRPPRRECRDRRLELPAVEPA
jgi:hypothetical protein